MSTSAEAHGTVADESGLRSGESGPLRVGLTGGIGAGKSTVAAFFAEAGAAVVDADRIAREVVEPGEAALEALVEEFGPQVRAEDGSLDRATLAAAAFASRERTAALNAIMHPAIAERTRAHFARVADRAVVVHDVPLLVENGLGPGYHLSVLVDVPAEVRLERLVSARGLDREDAERRIAQQAQDADRYRACDAVLDNTGPEEGLSAQFARLWTDRILPFARALAAPEAAGSRSSAGAAEEPGTSAQRAAAAHAVERHRARLERALAAAGAEGIGVELSEGEVTGAGQSPAAGAAGQVGAAAASGAAPPVFRLHGSRGSGALPAGVGRSLEDAGWLPDGSGRLRFGDPAQPAVLDLSAGMR